MYENTGEKIKSFAKAMATVEIIFCVLIGFILLFFSFISANSPDPEWYSWVFFGASLAVGVGGSLLAWFKFLFLAAFGELVEETTNSASYLKDIKEILVKRKL